MVGPAVTVFRDECRIYEEDQKSNHRNGDGRNHNQGQKEKGSDYDGEDENERDNQEEPPPRCLNVVILTFLVINVHVGEEIEEKNYRNRGGKKVKPKVCNGINDGRVGIHKQRNHHDQNHRKSPKEREKGLKEALV